jgi:hypothetical protein
MSLPWSIVLLLCLTGGIVGVQRAGWWWGRKRLGLFGDKANEGLGALDAAVFGLMGLLLAFTFTGAANRFDDRRDLIVDEVNALATSWLRMELLPEPARGEVRNLLREYLDGRIAAYSNASADPLRARAQLADHTARLQSRIWERLMTATRETPSLQQAALLPPVNQAFDLATTRSLATEQHPPLPIYGLLVTMVLISGFLAGFSQARASRQSWLHIAGFAATTTLALYLIIDLEHPRLGLIRVDGFDHALMDLRASWQ